MFYIDKKSFLNWIYLKIFLRFLSPRVLYYLNLIVKKCIPNPSKGYSVHHVSIFNQITLFTDQTSKNDTAHILEPEFLANGFLHSPEGKAAFKKLPDSIILDEYHSCQLEGLSYFDKVFRYIGGSTKHHSTIMVEHHRILATGIDGRHSYPVGFSSEHSKDVAGKLRHAGGRVAFPVRGSKSIKAVLKALTEIGLYPDGWWDIEIDGIPEKAWSKAKRIKKGFDIVHPDGKYIPIYFNKMGECLNYLRILQLKQSADQDITAILHALATYFHLGIHAHAFVRINQSLLWAQVNYILMLNNYLPVHHGFVDLVAAFLSTGHFCVYFKRYMQEYSAKMENISV